MKTDDDAFVRVDEILISLNLMNASHGLLYGLINSDSQPHRNPDSKWYISPEVLYINLLNVNIYIYINAKRVLILYLLKEWPEDRYPPWAHGPGYVISHDIAKAINQKHKKGRLKVHFYVPIYLHLTRTVTK